MKINKKEDTFLYENSPLKKIIQQLLTAIHELQKKYPKEDTLEYENASKWVEASEVILNILDKNAPKLEGYTKDVSLGSLILGLISDLKLINQISSLKSLSRTCRLIEVPETQELPTTWGELFDLLNGHNAIILHGKSLYCANIAEKSLRPLKETQKNKKSYDNIKSEIRSQRPWADSDTVASIRAVKGSSLMAPKIHHPLMYDFTVEIIQTFIRAPKELEALVPFLNPAIIQVDFFKDLNSNAGFFENPKAEIIKKLLGYYFKVEHVSDTTTEKQPFNYDYTEAKDDKIIHIHVNGSDNYEQYKQDKINEHLDEIICYLDVYADNPHVESLNKKRNQSKLEYERRFEAIRMRVEASKFTADLPMKVEKLTANQIALEIQQHLDLQKTHNPSLRVELEAFLKMLPSSSVLELLAQKKYRDEGILGGQLEILNEVDDKTEQKIKILKAAWKKRIKKECEEMLSQLKKYEAIFQSLPKTKLTQCNEKKLQLTILQSEENIKTLALIDLLQIKENLFKKLTPEHFKIENDESFNTRLERLTNYLDTLIENKNHLQLVFEKQIQESKSELHRLEVEKERLKREAEFALKMKKLNPQEIEDLMNAEYVKLCEKSKELEEHLALQKKVQESFETQLLKAEQSFQKAEKNFKQKEAWNESLTNDALTLAKKLPKTSSEVVCIKTQLAYAKDILAKLTNLPSVTALEQLQNILNAANNDCCIPFKGMEAIINGPINTLLFNLGFEVEQIEEITRFRSNEESLFSKPGHNTRIKFRTLINTFVERAKNKIPHQETLTSLVKNIEFYQNAITCNSEDKILDAEDMEKSSLEISRIKPVMEDNQQDTLFKEKILSAEKVAVENKYNTLKWYLSILKCMESTKHALELFVKDEKYEDSSAIYLENLYQELLSFTSQEAFDPQSVDNIQAVRLAFINTIDIPKAIQDKYRPFLDAIDFSGFDETYSILNGEHACSHSEFLEKYNQLVDDVVGSEVKLKAEENVLTNGVAKQMVAEKLGLLTELKQKVGTLGLSYQNDLINLLNNQANASVLFVGDFKESRTMKADNAEKIQALDDFLLNFPEEMLLQKFTSSVESCNPPLQNPVSLVSKRQDLMTNLNGKRILNENLNSRINERQMQVEAIFELLMPHLSARAGAHPIHDLNLGEKLQEFVDMGDAPDIVPLIKQYLAQYPGTYMKGILSKIATIVIDTKRKIPNQYERVEIAPPLDDGEIQEALLSEWGNNHNAKNELQQFVDTIKKMALFAGELPVAESVVVKNLSESLQFDLHQFLKKTKNSIPNSQTVDEFFEVFMFKLHSEDEIMSKHRAAWKPIVLNISIAATVFGLLLIALKLVISKVQTGRARFFSQNTARVNHVESVGDALVSLSHVIANEPMQVM